MLVIEQAEVMTTTTAAKEREERELMTRCLEEVINPRDAPVFTSFACIKEVVEGGGASPNVKFLVTNETLLQRLCYNAGCISDIDNSKMYSDLLLTFSFLLSRPDIDVLHYSRRSKCLIHNAVEVPDDPQFLEILLGESRTAAKNVDMPTLVGGLTALHIVCRSAMAPPPFFY